jgi:hypothetical protein
MLDSEDVAMFRMGLRALRLAYMVPAAVFYFLLYLVRRVELWYVSGRATDWQKIEAWVSDSFQIDENATSFSRNAWNEMENQGDYCPQWAIAIQYSYEAEGMIYAGIYFLPDTYTDGALASEAEHEWDGKHIIVRYNPVRASQSFFLQEDGAPGMPHIPRLLSYEPYITSLSLK